MVSALAQPADQIEQHLLDDGLHTARQIGVLRLRPVQRMALPGSGRAGRGDRLPVHRLGAETAVGARIDQFAEHVGEPRSPVGRHRHHLVLVAGALEAEVFGQALVEQAQ